MAVMPPTPDGSGPSGVGAVVLACLGAVAPDLDLAAVDGTEDLHDALGLDSMDVLRLMDAVEAATGVSIPERDYPRVQTLDALIAEVAARRPAGPPTGPPTG